MLALRDYQEEAVQAVIREAAAGTRRQLIQLPMGAGKTVIAAALSRKARGRTLMLVHRDELAQQSLEKFGYVWPSEHIGLVEAGRNDTDRRVVVGSVQTLAQPSRLAQLDAESFSLVVADEAHHATASSWLRVLEGLGMYPEVAPGRLLLGITATPQRTDGVGLNEVFDKIVYRRTIPELIERGYLADVRGYRIQTHVDLRRVRLAGGDFNARDLSLAVDTQNRNLLIAEAYEQYGEGRQAVAFTVDVAHAQHLADTFRKRGHAADWVSGELPPAERRRRLAAFQNGEIKVLTNALLLTEGWDEPSIGCVIMARPTRSATLFTQAVGRGLRPYPDKPYCIVLDVADTGMDLASIFSLEGFRERATRTATAPGETPPREAAPPPRDDHLAHAELVAAPVDLLARSAFRWHVEGRNRMRLEAGPWQDVYLLRDASGLWEVTLRRHGRDTPLSDRPLPIGYAQGVAEDYVRREGLTRFASRDAAWRSRPASERQLGVLRDLGVDPAAGLTQEAAQDLIRETRLRQALADPNAPWRSQPASERQIAWMRAHGLRVKPGMTKGDVADLMDRLRRKRRRAGGSSRA